MTFTTATDASRRDAYYAARLDYYTHGDPADLDRAEQIAEAAYAAGDDNFDEVQLDEDARIAANGGKPLSTR